MDHSWSVTQLTNYLKQSLETDTTLSGLSVVGEVSNLSSPPSGHRYFSLKDPQNVVSGVMWSSRPGIEHLKEGEQVLVSGKMTFYGPQGKCNLQADLVVPLGEGSLSIEFERLKSKLNIEGLFDLNRKRRLPDFPTVIGVVTSSSGSVWQDIQNVITRRYPLCELLLSHTSVQGVGASDEICGALELINLEGRADVIVLARGGGSLEDLWSFNEESVARAIFASKIPVVSAVGHETDVTIADMVADVRAPTPSAAAELVVPDIDNLRLELVNQKNRIVQNLDNTLGMNKYKVATLMENILRSIPQIDDNRRYLDEISQRVSEKFTLYIREHQTMIGALENQVRLLDFNSILARGFAYVHQRSTGLPIRSSHELNERDIITITFNDGDRSAQIL